MFSPPSVENRTHRQDRTGQDITRATRLVMRPDAPSLQQGTILSSPARLRVAELARGGMPKPAGGLAALHLGSTHSTPICGVDNGGAQEMVMYLAQYREISLLDGLQQGGSVQVHPRTGHSVHIIQHGGGPSHCVHDARHLQLEGPLAPTQTHTRMHQQRSCSQSAPPTTTQRAPKQERTERVRSHKPFKHSPFSSPQAHPCSSPPCELSVNCSDPSFASHEQKIIRGCWPRGRGWNKMERWE